MRVWLIGLGMVDDDFKPTRKFLFRNLTGNIAWRYGAPEKKAVNEAADGADTGTETPAAGYPVEEDAAYTADMGASNAGEAGATHEYLSFQGND